MTLAPYLLKLLGAILVIFTYLRLQKIPNIQQRDNLLSWHLCLGYWRQLVLRSRSLMMSLF